MLEIDGAAAGGVADAEALPLSALVLLSSTESASAEGAPFEAPLPALGRRRGRYDDLGLVRRHRFVEVRRLRDRVLRRTVMQKRVWRHEAPRSVTARLIAEGELLAQLDHPGVVPILDLAESEDGQAFFTMPEVAGACLGTWMMRMRGADLERRRQIGQAVVSWLADVCRAVAYAHDRGVSHGDLKPEHVLIRPAGPPCVLDWGLANTCTGPIAAVTTVTGGGPGLLAGLGAGTPPYRAPEVAQHPGRAAADVYAVGTMLGEVCRQVAHDGLGAAVTEARSACPDRRPAMHDLAASLAAMRL